MAYTHSTETLIAALKRVLPASSYDGILDLWPRYLRSKGYTGATVLDMLKKMAVDRGTTPQELLNTPVRPLATFDPAAIDAALSLSNGNLTVTNGGPNATWSSVRSTVAGVNKFYVEFVGTTGIHALGVMLGTASLAAIVGGDANSFGVVSAGATTRDGVLGPVIVPWNPGDTVDMAVDIAARLLWYRVNNGNWNGSATANPSTGAEGLPLSTNMATGPLYFGASLADTGQAITVNFGASFSRTPPQGFGTL